jgi:hypothetical protein
MVNNSLHRAEEDLSAKQDISSEEFFVNPFDRAIILLQSKRQGCVGENVTVMMGSDLLNLGKDWLNPAKNSKGNPVDNSARRAKRVGQPVS